MKHQLKIYGPAVLLVLAGFVIAFQFIKPAPPDRVTIASGGSGGAYFAFAGRYAERLAKEGIQLEVLQTAGSVENIDLMHRGEADIALIQSGIEDQQQAVELQSIGSLYFEPLWLFHHDGVDLDRLQGLRGLRVATGGEGSGTHALVSRLLRDNGLLPLADERILGGKQAVAAFNAGELDALFLVGSPRGELIQGLLRTPGVSLASFQRAAAYERRYRFLSSVELPEGVVDLEQNIPPRSVRMLAPAANLVVRSDIHPAIIDLLLQAAEQAHSQGDWFEDYGQFPQDGLLAYPLAGEARRYYENGPPFLQRYLPFWAASLVDRLKVMLLPLMLMLLPLFKIMPPIYSWRMHARVYRWYDKLEKLELRIDSDTRQRRTLEQELDRIEAEVRHISLPLSFTRHLYHLRQHIDLVRARLRGSDL